jgi:hypothetical protein
MIRYLSTLLCCAVCSVTVLLSGADKLAIAEPVAKGGVSPQEVEALWGMLEANVGGFELISRSALKQMLAEIGFTDTSGLTNPNSVQKAKLGEIKTVQYILISEVNRFGARYNVNLLLVDSSTGSINPDKRGSVTVNSFDEFSDKLPDTLREMGLGRPVALSGRAALLEPVIKQAGTPPYMRDQFNDRMQAALLENGIRLYQLQNIRRILSANNIAALDEAEPAMYARIGELLRADYLIQPVITTFATRIDRKFIKASNRTVIKCIGDMNGSVKIVNAKTGDLLASIPFRNRIDFADLDDDMTDWTPEDYGNYLIEATLKELAPKVLERMKTEAK